MLLIRNYNIVFQSSSLPYEYPYKQNGGVMEMNDSDENIKSFTINFRN